MNAYFDPDARSCTATSPKSVAAQAAAERANRQSELLDEGLLETFPASDPVSIVRIT